MRVRVFVNCAAGSVDADEVESQLDGIRSALAGAHLDGEVSVVDPSDLVDEIGRAVADGPDAVVVAGGDGTLSCAAGALADQPVPLGVLPFGTFNHFAGDLGVPERLEDAVAVLAAGDVRSVDVAEVNGEVFVNNSVLGVYPKIVDSRDSLRRRRGWGKVRALPVAVVKVFHRMPTHRFRLQTDAGRDTVRTPFVFIGNNRYEFAGSGSGERPAIDAGTLCVYLVRVTSRWGLFRTIVHTAVRGAESARGMERLDVRELTVESPSAHLDVALDGEVRTMTPPLHYRIRPGALRVLAPPEHQPAVTTTDA